MVAPAPVPTRHSPMMQQQPRAPGMFGTMAAAMGGSMLGNAVSHRLFDAPQPTSAGQVEEMKPVMEQSPCAQQFDMYAKCMQFNNDDASKCDYVWNSVSQCRKQAHAAQEMGETHDNWFAEV